MMEYSLCGGNSCCPMLKVKGKKVLIGEEGNLAELNASEWNELVKLIKSKKLGEI